MGKHDTNPSKQTLSRRYFLKGGAAVGGAALAGMGAKEASAQTIAWNREADIIVVGAGVSGLSASIEAAEHGASVIAVDMNYDIGGHGIMSGGQLHLGGGNEHQRLANVKDSPDSVFKDWTRHDHHAARYSDRDLVRVFADWNVDTYNWLLKQGVKYETGMQQSAASTVPRQFRTLEWNIQSELIAPRRNRNGSGLVRPLAASARAKGVDIVLNTKMTRIIREEPLSGRVLGVAAEGPNGPVNYRARRGVIVCTGGHSSNVTLRRTFDPRLTEEYQVACSAYSLQSGDGEIAAMDIGAALWATANQTAEAGAAITKTRHIGCQWGYASLVYEPDSPLFPKVRAMGLTVEDFQNVIMVKENGLRFFDETRGGYDFFAACLAWSGNPEKLNGGGPIWAVFDQAAVEREKWVTKPPYVDLSGWFFQGDTLKELAANIGGPYQRRKMDGSVLEETVAKFNAGIDAGKDEFGRKALNFKIDKPPFFAAWSTPILHDTLSGIHTNTDGQVVDRAGKTIPGLYCAGETMGGFAQHGLARCIIFGRVAARHAATVSAASL
jgi:succinate dehydrogenase/fumarate reductase flavoprotein subunit